MAATGDITAVGVIGARQMGSGIAQLAAAAGCVVLLLDSDPAAHSRIVSSISASLHRLAAKGQLSQAACKDSIKQIRCVSRMQDFDSMNKTHLYWSDLQTPLSLVDGDLKNKRRTPAESPRSYPWKPMLVGVRATSDVADFASVAYPYRVLPLSTPLKAANEGEAVVAGKGAARQLGGGGGGDRDERAWVSLRSV